MPGGGTCSASIRLRTSRPREAWAVTWRRVAIAAAVVLGSVAAIQQALTVRDRDRYPAPGLLVQSKGHEMHLLVRGPESGGPTAVPRLEWVPSHRTGIGAAGACTDGPKRCGRSCRAWLEPAEPEAARCTGDCDRATRCFAPGRYRAAIRACRAFLRWAAGSCLCRPLSGADRWVGPGRCVATVRVELIKPAGSPPTVLITWPAAPSVTNTDPRGLASIAAALVRVLAEAQARLAKINTKGRRS